MLLENNLISLEFDDANGSLIQIEDKKRGIRHLGEPSDGRFFKIVVPDEENNLARICESHLNQPSEMTKQDDRLVIRYASLRSSENEKLEIEALVMVSLPEKSEEARFDIKIVNNSPFMIDEVFFPYVGGWRGDTRSGMTCFRVGIERHDIQNQRRRRGNYFCKSHRRSYWSFPMDMALPMLDISGKNRGISYICYPKQPCSEGVYMEDMNERAGNLRPAWSWVYRPFIKSGGEWQSDPVGISTHAGDWHVTGDRLRTWLETWWKKPEYTERLRESMGLFMTSFRGFGEGNSVNSVQEVIDMARYCKGIGIDHLLLWDFMMGLYLRPGKFGLLDETEKHINDVKRITNAICKMDMQVSTYVNLNLSTGRSDGAGNVHDKFCMRGKYGNPCVESYPWRSEYGAMSVIELDEDSRILCPSNPEFQEWALSMVKKCLNLGFNSYAFDQPFNRHCCFSNKHGHEIPAHAHAGICKWIKKAVQIIRENDSKAVTIGENLDMWNNGIMDLNFNWYWSSKNIEAYRYVFPDALIAYPLDVFEQEDELPRAFALGCLLAVHVKGSEKSLAEVPEFAQKLKLLGKLRKKTAAFTVLGRFIDQKDLTIDTDVKLTAAVYDGGDKIGIVLGESSQIEKSGGGKVKLILSTSELGRTVPKSIVLHRESGDVKKLDFTVVGNDVRMEIDLQRWECAVLEIF